VLWALDGAAAASTPEAFAARTCADLGLGASRALVAALARSLRGGLATRAPLAHAVARRALATSGWRGAVCDSPPLRLEVCPRCLSREANRGAAYMGAVASRCMRQRRGARGT
jgi:hypothetical protein